MMIEVKETGDKLTIILLCHIVAGGGKNEQFKNFALF